MRADVYLTQNGYAESRNKASKLIDEGLVRVDGVTLKKSSEDISEEVSHSVEIKEHDSFVGRGALKLISALETFGVDVSGKKCVDIGASTGGFTQVLLMSEAMHVTAIDSGKGQLHKSLCQDERVLSVEGYNARNINASEFGTFDCAVMDVSFISQTLILAPLSTVIVDKGVLISLIKPQFESGRSAVGKNGIVKKAEDREAALMKVISSAEACGFSTLGIIKSPIEGGDGNIEYLGYFKKSSDGSIFGVKDLKIDIKRI